MDTLQYMPNIPAAKSKRIVIIGGGFAGMKLTFKLANTGYQVVLIDKNNYHQFQPLFYQVATAGLAPGDISVSYTHLRAHETVLDLVCRLLLEKKKHILLHIHEPSLAQQKSTSTIHLS